MDVVYTFSSIFENFKIINKEGKNEIKNNNLNLNIKEDSILRINVSKLKSENDLDKNLFSFYDNRELNICIIKFEHYDNQKMNSII